MTSGTGPGRRVFLLGAAVAVTGLATGLVSGCTSRSGPRPSPSPTPTPPSPDELAAGRAVRSARALLATESTVTGVKRKVAVLLPTLVAAHREHLTALGMPDAASGSSATPTATGSTAPGSTAPSGAPSPSSPSPGPASPGSSSGAPSPTAWSPVALAAAERAAAEEALADVAITTPATAGLLARIAAARAVHADLVRSAAGLAALGELTVPAPSPATPAPDGSGAPSSPGATTSSGDAAAASPGDGAAPSGTTPTGATTPPGPSPAPSPGGSPLDATTAAALSTLLAGEHAAVFAYGLIAARVPAAKERLARSLWEAHRERRDELERRLVAAGRTPAAAEPAYDVDPVPTTAAQVAALAATVEDGLAGAAFGAVTRTTGTVRQEVATDLVRAARRAATWRGHGTALPGTPA